MTANKHLMVVAGGTGGHIFPGIAVAEHMQQQGWTVSWVGTADRMEAQLVPKHGFEIDFVEVQGVRGNGITRLLKAPFMVLKAILAAKKIIKQRKPAVILAMGGYVTGPVGIAAKLSGVPLVIHEQNAVAGFSNRLLAKVANQVLAAFPNAFENNAEVVGNPVRASVSAIDKKSQTEQLNVLVVGGSLGAQVLNERLPEVFSTLAKDFSLSVRHQSGRNNQDKLKSAYVGREFDAQVDEFIHDMDAAYAWADLVICRAGALTVSEVAAAGKAALFVPLPHAVDDHQTANARYLVDQQGGLLMPQHDFTTERLIELLTPYFEQPSLLSEIADKAKQLAKFDATERVAKVCGELAK
ncbi:undecaprenyldiphospho-muramoylpentapeptide beta-N-acetylglucosaminyltransferase [Pseudoalteromonas phenolica]|uniref:UDP-N-acetylglucosamine--N-acetylmuramyl-(pentapeptide) pyrophosphoryl-undecaprenol N-acetylglucosamine transferase n=1 Tax=Pseudoalteromonas phenolica TaxID=161398 RepID=A0A0S2JY13_9GAMM|nr:undecaprenyldiphospho-muramoylpentapeptide beta-N-acetylglucosaminyltransferase [Pseudoalteromonas phenolica]ALO40886.1 UDP-N-acetylglucosamine--N-acetylmuramyl-(pentapeptide) pyrophosphoryl-undecaprenol N-acetylglucosamine transferase [Pseudoalteromonas phenolica]MBE0354593.1 UDP-N-acetylglucosamine--N-acetylmuramyl-(pentapeptide) pyrophosphoryl-undecaprenol N-acetylglucosamine transferase [Pseudoalteromonas phenolica O-BC30]RXE92837.1 undecaprenyldiphospho-muramoylpentapeptide beta-N-acetyl